MTRELLTALFFFLALTSCNFGEKGNSIKQNEEGTTPTHSQTNLVDKELEYSKIRDRYINYFKTSVEKHYDWAILDKQDNDSLLVLEKMLKEILKDARVNGISKNGKINLETLLPDMGFGGLDGLVLNKNKIDRNAPEIVVTTKTLFFEYFKAYQINTLDSLTKEQLDNIFTSALGRGEVSARTFSIVKKIFTKSGHIYGCIGSLGQESGDFLPPNYILVLSLNEGYIYIISEYLEISIIELQECQYIADSLNALSDKYHKLYEESIPKDNLMISKSVDFQQAAWVEYCKCYQRNLNDELVFEKIKKQVTYLMQYGEK